MFDSTNPPRLREHKIKRGTLATGYDLTRLPTEEITEATGLQREEITEATGLQRAYQQGDAYPFGNTLFIAGSHTAKDWYDDVTKIPFWGDVRTSTRYQQAEKALKANPNITRVVGHSLGGSVALELQRNYPNLQSRTYGAPVLDLTGSDAKAERYRNWLDPVSVLDRSATRSVKWNPLDSASLTHAYDNIAQKFQVKGDGGWKNPDGTVSLQQ
jgi:pimeloyl-ACP methyl ester carboxylesterase